MRILLGNVISLVGALFLWASCFAKTKRRVLLWQLFQCLSVTLSQLVFGRWSGAVSMGVAALRNFLISFGVYTLPIASVLAATTFALGIKLNFGGIVGILPVAVGVVYTLGLCRINDVKALKIMICGLLSVWIVYSALIFDLFGVISYAAAAVFNGITLRKIIKGRRELDGTTL